MPPLIEDNAPNFGSGLSDLYIDHSSWGLSYGRNDDGSYSVSFLDRSIVNNPNFPAPRTVATFDLVELTDHMQGLADRGFHVERDDLLGGPLHESSGYINKHELAAMKKWLSHVRNYAARHEQDNAHTNPQDLASAAKKFSMSVKAHDDGVRQVHASSRKL